METVEILKTNLEGLNVVLDNSDKSINQLRSELSDLRKSLNDATIGTEEFDNTFKELTKTQQQLASATKGTATVIAGSYNALTIQMQNLKKSWKEAATVSERNNIAKEIKSINDQLKQMDSEIGNFQRNVGSYGNIVSTASDATNNLTSGLNSAMMIMNTMGVETDGMTRALQDMALAMNFAKGLKDLAKGSELFEKLSEAIKKSALAQKLFGDSQKSTTAATKAQTAATAAEATATNTATVSTGLFSKALGVLKKALISTGIGALVVGIGMLIAHMEDIIKLFRKSSGEARDYAAELDKVEEAQDLINQSTERSVRLAKAQGKSLEEVHKIRMAGYKASMTEIVVARAGYSARMEYLKAQKKLTKEEKDELEKLNEAYKKADQNAKDLKKIMESAELDFQVDLQIEGLENEKKAADNAKKAFDQAEAAWNRYKESRESYKTKNDDILFNAEEMDERAKSFAQLKKSFEDTTDALEKNRKAENKAITDALNAGVIGAEEAEKRMADIKKEYDDVSLKLEEKYHSDEKKLKEKYAKEDEDFAKQVQDERIKTLLDNYKTNMEIYQREYDARRSILEMSEDETGLTELDQKFLQKQLNKLLILRANLAKYGNQYKDDLISIDTEINSVLIQLNENNAKMIQAKADELDEIINHMSESVNSITSIGDGLSSKWGAVFDTIGKGIQNVSKELIKSGKSWQTYSNMAVAALSVASGALAALSDEQDTSTREGFEASKKFNIAQVIMNTLSGIITAWSTSMQLGPIAGPIAAGTMTALLTGLGAAQVAKIKSTTFGGDTSIDTTPSKNAVLNADNGVNYAAVVNPVNVNMEDNNSRVYVLESDITDTMKNVNVIENDSTF